MIWIALVCVFALAAGTLLLAKTMRTRLLIGAAGLLAIGGYWIVGKPDMGDEPLSMRLESLESQARTAADTLTPDQMMALIEKRAKEKPNDPEPHKYMGDLLKATGRPGEAIMAYQSALRRDPNYQPAIKALADAIFESSGEFTPDLTALYHRAYELDPTDLRIGYFAAIGDWRAGDKAKAEEEFKKIEAQAPAGDPRLRMFAAMRAQFASDQPPASPPADQTGPAAPPAKSPTKSPG